MAPRKSDSRRKSNVSTARFAAMDEAMAPIPTGLPPVTPAAAAITVSATPSSAAAAPTPESGKVPSSTLFTPMEKAEKAPKEKIDKDALTIEDLNLPKSIVTRLAKGMLAPNAQIQANAVLAMSKSATVFINYLASHANQNTINANKKTVSAEDVFKALDEIEFGFLREPLEQEFAKFNQIQSAKRSSYRQKVAAKKGGATAAGASADNSILTTASSADGNVPRRKKARVDESAMAVDEDADGAETEPEEEADEDEEEEEEEAEDEEDEEDSGEGSVDETQDALEEKVKDKEEDVDEALDGDESD